MWKTTRIFIAMETQISHKGHNLWSAVSYEYDEMEEYERHVECMGDI